MFSLFKTVIKKAAPFTLKGQVRSFWQWYAQEAPRFFIAIEEGNCESLGPEVSEKVDEFFPWCKAWVFGPGKKGLGHSFTLSGEGLLHHQLLIQFWHSQAPSLSGWTFYPARQPNNNRDVIKTDGRNFTFTEFWITPIENSEKQKIDIVAWHPLFEQLERKDCMFPLYLFLDDALGEYGTEQWIGDIKLNNQRLSEAMPLDELSTHIKKLEKEKGWEKFKPGEDSVIYDLKPNDQKFLRADVLFGTTTNLDLIREYHRAGGELVDPLAESGADYVFIMMDASGEHAEGRFEKRKVIEAALEKNLNSNADGRLLGNASSKLNSYIDLLLFDGDESLKTVVKVLKDQNVPEGTSINFFAKEKSGHRIVL